MADPISGFFSGDTASRTTLVVSTTVVTTLSLFALFRYSLYPKRQAVYPSPIRTVIPKLSKDEIAKLPYQPDTFPGARDVETPYGFIRVYEWGPETGRKVLFIHGISSSCQTLQYVAHALVAKGCRVMLFDLYGRGFSDGVGDLPHDARLYVSQALLVLASSRLPWTGDAGFHLVGYSLGGGIAVHLANAFPRMVDTLVLLAPAGLIRPANFGSVTRWVFTSGFIPDGILARLTKRRLQQPISASTKRGIAAAKKNNGGGAAAPAPEPRPAHPHHRHHHHHHPEPIEEAAHLALSEAADSTPVTPLEWRVLEYVQWMTTHHAGFIPAFMSTLRFAPMMGQEQAWSRLAERSPGTTCIIVGNGDEIVSPEDYEVDALPLVGGKERVEWAVVDGGHDFPMVHPEETLDAIYGFWGWEKA